jgi:hypothetical protein
MKSFLEGRATVAKEGAAPIRSAPTVNYGLPTFAKAGKDSERAIESVEPPPSQTPRHSQVKVEAVEEQGVVRSIIVTCSCGEQIEVHCGY